MDTARSVVVVIVTLAALAAAFGQLAKSKYVGRPLRWLWRRNISNPIGGWMKFNVQVVVDDRIDHLMHNNNHGSSLKDLADGQEAIKAQVAAIQDNVTTILSAQQKRIQRDWVEHERNDK